MIEPREIFAINSAEAFRTLALKIFSFQFEYNTVYRSFCDLLLKHPSNVSKVEDIPFLPIQFFKSHDVILKELSPEKIFLSSGTTKSIRSQHQIANLKIYEQSFRQGFKTFYGDFKEYCILALLPSYIEQGDSSLVYMMQDLIEQSQHPKSGFYLDNYSKLIETLNELENKKQKTLLMGVSYALLDLIEKQKFNFENTIVMETGGMKGRRKELIRSELHAKLKAGFGVENIHSEYGMTELLSQGYSKQNGIFNFPPWIKVLTRSVHDPLEILNTDKTGGINVIDLANLNSCSFIATQDLGKVNKEGSFEVIGRFDNAEVRGCNLMAL